MSLPVKRQHEGTAAVVEGTGTTVTVTTGKPPQPQQQLQLQQQQQQQQHVGVVGSGMVMESANASFGGVESRPAKVARHNDRAVEPVEKLELFSISFKPGRDGGGSSGSIEVPDGEGNGSKDGPVVPQLKIKVREFGSAAEGKSDREGRVDAGRMDLERKASGGKDYGDVVVKESSSGNKELLARVDVKQGEELLQQQQQQQGGVSGEVVGQELAENNRGEGNSEGLMRKKSPREGEAKIVVKDVPMDVKREELREKEKEKKDEKRIERKEDVPVAVLQQQQPQLQLLQPHSDVHNEKDNNEKDEMEKDKGGKEKEKERVRERERSRDREKEAVRLEKRDKREKERDRDSHRREREEREESLVDKFEKEEGKGVKIEELEMDRKPVREVDDRKLVEKEPGRERVRERDRDKEKDEAEGEGGEKRKKRGREQEKDRDSLTIAMDTEGAGGEKDKDAVHGYGVQQRKRMLRPRGQSNPAHRDSRSRFRPKDNEGTQGRPENTSIIYRVGEGMPELAKLRKEYVESGERTSSANGSGPTVEIRIPAELATTTNRQIRGSQLWGTDIYTDDSDIVAVLMHTGYFSPLATPPPNSISELRATIRILESQTMYTSTLRNSLRSRAWGGGSGCSYSMERCRIMKQGGGTVELEPCLTRNPQVAPTLAPAASERTVTTRAASSSAYRQQRFMQEVTIQYNLCNEPWAKYHMSIVADRGLKKSQFTSARLKKGEVLFVETHVHRYELAYDGERTTCNGATSATSSFPQGTSGMEKGKEKWGSTERALVVIEKEPILHTHNGEKSHGNHPSNGQTGGHHSHSVMQHNGELHECYRWSKCKRPLSLSSMKKKGVPLPEEFVEVLEEGLRWEEVQWAPTSVWVRGTEYILTRAQFFSFDKDDMKE